MKGSPAAPLLCSQTAGVMCTEQSKGKGFRDLVRTSRATAVCCEDLRLLWSAGCTVTAGLRETSSCVSEAEDKCYAEITVSCSLSRRNLSCRWAPRQTRLCREQVEDRLVGWTKHSEFRVSAVPLYLLLQSTRWQWGSLVPLLSCCTLWSSLRRGCRDRCSRCGRHSAAILRAAPLLSATPGCLSCETTRCSQSHLRSDSPSGLAVRGAERARSLGQLKRARLRTKHSVWLNYVSKL